MTGTVSGTELFGEAGKGSREEGARKGGGAQEGKEEGEKG